MVEAYVFADEPVNHVKIARVHSEGAAEMIPVENATVSISQGDKFATLELRDGSSGIYGIPNPNITFSGSEVLNLEIAYKGKIYRASTTFPAALESASLSNEVVQATGAENGIPLTTFSWTDPHPERTYCIFTRGISADSLGFTALQTSQNSPLFNLNYDNAVNLHADHFTHLGSYQLYVSAVNEEYTQMYYGGNSPDLRGAPTNIHGAWGVFTAFNGLSVDITVE
jgi:hypothetical protein